MSSPYPLGIDHLHIGSTYAYNRAMANGICGHEIFDGNEDDPSYAYCGHPFAHAGDHGNWEF